ncbi:HNH endonuclease signature motif containing protein [Aspergillus clavatus NRRL 1]|uniref:HNH nuclease domain-containing protein n=1 Tax=Aspergillus clavatus (strain ATCC 1007 / CBS 513.65 / DSM 816 / NCTC 3887 / NRRL 1 / QM 1276 / 107) TaxID=344612 RepID=A1C9L4_ASPCL|nr:uncharacterized protein ACLA_055860 [Aspergillus clavatus NRRL 1]EAW13538.1 hypothetical protein ACLA_055860 [Aspergillus clavatus NRRL 1]
MASTGCISKFPEHVQERDGRRVITGEIDIDADVGWWVGYEAAYIAPLSLDEICMGRGFSNMVTYNGPPDINSPQNGILPLSNIHQLWDNHSTAVNPNAGYKVMSFQPHAWQYHGYLLDPVCRQPDDARRVIDGLLRWHFEQAVLYNMRGVGEAAFEF